VQIEATVRALRVTPDEGNDVGPAERDGTTG
jgi:hypothetical protein